MHTFYIFTFPVTVNSINGVLTVLVSFGSFSEMHVRFWEI